MIGIGDVSFNDLIERRLSTGLPGEQLVELFKYYELFSEENKIRFVADLLQILVAERCLRKHTATAQEGGA